ncbi:heat-shock protein Hsp70 [Frateuria sp. Soil773]|uniref:Hsp70 family protein n=1 Tax=Frateuria sp. Soil773 TaxID=1736407 RepID=UPI0006F22680|nr:Hsp70 family protein [Frateuria sp. Soil773]KRE89212.1 heat-shock protein Hsp70 [Frateuria sp. Soil773]
MRIGIDFGTSYSAAAAIVDGRLELVRFGETKQFRTAVFFPEQVPDPADFELTPALAAQVESIVRSSRMQQGHASEALLRRDALRVVRRQWMEEQTRAGAVSITDFQHALFGDEAVDAYLDEGGGHLVESPKSMLGYRLDPPVRQVIVNIAAHILEHIRLTATRQFGVPVRGAVIGRPVEFRSSMGEAGGAQALELLREAAAIAGFDEVAFLEEPAAAAMHYHLELAERRRTLIVDIGGGTTDVAYAELGGDEAPLIHRSWGLPKGGSDLDLGVNLHSFMPHFGREAAVVPAHHFVEAASVYILPKQREFRRQNYRLVEEPFGSRLRALQEPGATTRLNRLGERIKIELGTALRSTAALDFIEGGLAVAVGQGDFALAAEDFMARLRRLLEQARGDIGAVPATVFLTGGSSRSPHLQAAVCECFPESALVEGDPSLGVVSGLAVAACA